MFKNTETHFGLMSILLHWVSAVVVVGLFALGYWMVDLTYYSSWYKTAPELHKSVGVLLLLATLARLLWRWSNPKPRGLAGHQAWEKTFGAVVHALLYLLLIAILCSGYLISTADGRGIMVFGLFELPSLGSLFNDQADLAGVTHQYLAYSLIALVGIHVLGAIKHHVIDKDSTLVRMVTIKEIK
ncbi:cytochrome b [Shewanella psychrotolerans]|uniref:cytochrome b n=1 Tax=Shewanella psychrotolerans TaxID=2864206 RepID=UPI001C655D49|nr:cytochrome b [Shewanella psychrotolerans]QYK00585.1 cytochrome b [Shewanella psychrotolerans]